MLASSAIYEYFKGEIPTNSLLVCNNDKEAFASANLAQLAGYKPFVLPDIRVSYGEDLRSYSDEMMDFVNTLGGYYRCDTKKILISPIRTLQLPFPKQEYCDSLFTISFGDTIHASFKDMCYYWGYQNVDILTQRGEISWRGDVIDIYPPNATTPYRLSLFGNEVENIRRFDLVTQKSIQEELELIELTPPFLGLSQDTYEAILYRAKHSSFDVFIRDIDAVGWWVLEDLAAPFSDFFAPIATIITEEISPSQWFTSECFASMAQVPPPQHYRDIVVPNVGLYLQTHIDKKITIVAKNESTLRGSGLDFPPHTTFAYQEGEIFLASKDELIVSLNKPSKQKRVKKSTLILDELKPGDYVVHENYGVGHFRAIEKREVLGATREFVVIVYQNEDMLLVPVENLEVIDRYIAQGGSVPILDKLGKASFRHLKAKVRDKLFAIASEIIQMAAKRHLQQGIKIEIDSLLHSDFMSQSGFLHTQDQEEAIYAILQEMASGQMMDRLLSADVGFGKTEVAMNAMFAVVKSGYQAMMIAPTTLLSAQHYRSIYSRFNAHGIQTARLDRFTTTKEKTKILKGLREGSIDIVVGTHALLGVEFAKLALVVIDEEHKFGVKQKEALKALTANVHLLSMSATPIPRSLNLALSRIKTFSEILTPPTERLGVRTFVKSYDPKAIKEVILRELRRGGQVFYVFNSIAAIEEKRRTLLEILPTLRIAVLHSGINAKETEEEMMAFEEGKYDVLLSTTIIESGIHMPNANTMIVDGAQNFGIADLHQLRGRVGRGTKEGYCYFVVEDKESLSENAKRRLVALESHSDLGSGAILALHDLEIRGGGNLIGEAQSGHIKQIGYGLYLRMLEDALQILSGEPEATSQNVEIKLAVTAYLNEELISEDRLRLELYRRLAQCQSVQEVYEIEAEIADRFGKLDLITRQFIDIMAMKVMAKARGIGKISSYQDRIFIEFFDEDKERLTINSPTRDDDDIIATTMQYLRAKVS